MKLHLFWSNSDIAHHPVLPDSMYTGLPPAMERLGMIYTFSLGSALGPPCQAGSQDLTPSRLWLSAHWLPNGLRQVQHGVHEAGELGVAVVIHVSAHEVALPLQPVGVVGGGCSVAPRPPATSERRPQDVLFRPRALSHWEHPIHAWDGAKVVKHLSEGEKLHEKASQGDSLVCI